MQFFIFLALKRGQRASFFFFITWAQMVLSAVVFLYSDSGIIANSELKKYCIFFPLASLFFSLKCSLNWNAYLSFSRETKVLTHHQITQMYCTLNLLEYFQPGRCGCWWRWVYSGVCNIWECSQECCSDCVKEKGFQDSTISQGSERKTSSGCTGLLNPPDVF